MARNERVKVDYCIHTIPEYAVEVKCAGCHQRATHKIEETSGPDNFHPLTAYVCCGCFALVGDCSNYPYDITPWDDPHDPEKPWEPPTDPESDPTIRKGR